MPPASWAQEDPPQYEPLPGFAYGDSDAMPWEIGLKFGFDKIISTANPGDWYTGTLEVSRTFAPRTVIYGHLLGTSRFNKPDAQVMVGGYYPVLDPLTLNAEISVSPTRNVLPTFTGTAKAHYVITQGLAVELGYRLMSFPTSLVNTGTLMLEGYLGPLRASGTVYVSHVQDAITGPVGVATAGLLKVDYFYTDTSFVGLGGSFGTELTRLPNEIRIDQVPSVFANGRHWFTPAWGLTYMVGWQQQGESYSKFGGEVGARYRF